MNEQAMMVPAGSTARRGAGGDEMIRSAETSESAMTAQVTAEVQARYVMAKRAPRSSADARIMLLRECERPGFAACAVYQKPIGGGKSAEGLSIRFAEAAERAWGNIGISKAIVFDDAEKRIVRVTAVDFESNVIESVDVLIEKTVERKFLKDGQQPLRSRVNSYGDIVYLIPADEGSMLTKQKAEVAKAKREVVLGMIPGDIRDECLAEAKLTQRRTDAVDPAAAVKKLCDAFADINVRPTDLERYLGHPVEACSPVELVELRAIYAAVREGEATWNEVMMSKTGEAPAAQQPRVDAVKEAIANRANRGKKQPQRGNPGNGAVSADQEPTDAEMAQ